MTVKRREQNMPQLITTAIMSGFPSKTLKACAIKPPTSIDQIPFQMLLILDE